MQPIVFFVAFCFKCRYFAYFRAEIILYKTNNNTLIFNIMKHIYIITISCLIAGALITTSCQKQNTKERVFTPMQCDTIEFVIEGTASEGVDSVYFKGRPLWFVTETRTMWHQAYPVNNGHFCFTVREPLYKFMEVDDGNGKQVSIIADTHPAKVVFDLETKTLIEGSPLNERFSQYLHISDSILYLMNQHSNDNDGTIYDSYAQQWNEYWWQLINENHDNVIPVYYLSPFIMNMSGILQYEQLAEFMKEEYVYTQHPLMELVWKKYWEMEKRLTGQKYHDVEMKDTTGAPHRLSEFVGHGKYVLLDYWASWCGPCLASMPTIKELHNKYANHLQIIGITLDNNHDKWVNAIKRYDLSWVHLTDMQGFDNEGFWISTAADAYGVRAIPETVLISPEGEIIATGLDGEKLKAKLEEIFSVNK